MRKIVIAGSAKFYKEALELKKELENKDYNVIDYPKNINELTKEKALELMQNKKENLQLLSRLQTY